MAEGPVLAVAAATSDRIAARFCQAGDRQVLIEFGDLDLDLRLNFHVHAVLKALGEDPIVGVTDAAPGFRSVMVTFDPAVITRDQVVTDMTARLDSMLPIRDLTIASRIITLPIAFDDEMVREAVHRYRITTRSDAPNVSPGDNIDYIVKYNGFDNREAFFDAFLRTTWWNAFVGYFPGLPSLFSMDPLTQIAVPKYNPARMWTAEGAVGIGGPTVVIYPIESPGSYQLFGRTLPIMDLWQRSSAFADDPILFRVGDRVRFEPVTEPELLARRREVLEGGYLYRIEETTFDVSSYLQECDALAERTAVIQERRAAAAAKVAVP